MFFFLLSFSCSTDSGKGKADNTAEHIKRSLPAHDLRSPLATIRATAELLPDEKERAGQAEYAENIRHASDYMLSLVDTLMNFYLLDTGQARENISVFCLETLFREIANNYMPLVHK